MNEGAAAIGWRSPAVDRADAGVFIDRDGGINERPLDGFVLEWSAFTWRPDAVAALRTLTERGWPVIVVSNQSCVGRGLLDERTLIDIMQRMADALRDAGAPLAGWYCCPHAPDAGCDCRKPLPGMLKRAIREFGIDPERSHMIGDSDRDIEAGAAAGCTTHLIDGGDPTALERVVAHIPRAPSAQRRLEGRRADEEPA